MTRAALGAEFAGTAILLVAVVGSGIAIGDLSAPGGGLFFHAIAVGLALGALIAVLGGVSGAHFNPAVTAAFVARGRLPVREGVAYASAQLVGAVVGTVIAHASFGLPLLSASAIDRSGVGPWIGESVATVVLVAAILILAERGQLDHVPAAVGAWVAAAIILTSSTGFANPAVTVARAASDTPSGIAVGSVPMFVLVQFGAAAAATLFATWIARHTERRAHEPR